MSLVPVERLAEIGAVEFPDIVVEAFISDVSEIRFLLPDGSYVDVWFSLKLVGRYSYHWERQAIDGTIYRHDNAPHLRWRSVSTFPHHFHAGSEDNVVASNLSQQPEQALREFLVFVRQELTRRAAR